MAARVVWRGTCQGINVHGHCMYGLGDLVNLTLRPEFIANRIEINFQPLTVKCLEAWHRYKEICPPTFNDTFYRQLPFVIPSQVAREG